MGITQQAVQKRERYDSDPKLSTLHRYANAVGAIVQHTVTPDIAQSIPMAAASRWEPAGSTRTLPVSLPTSGATTTESTAWADRRRTDFAAATITAKVFGTPVYLPLIERGQVALDVEEP